jgi:hypothetical protein
MGVLQVMGHSRGRVSGGGGVAGSAGLVAPWRPALELALVLAFVSCCCCCCAVCSCRRCFSSAGASICASARADWTAMAPECSRRMASE